MLQCFDQLYVFVIHMQFSVMNIAFHYCRNGLCFIAEPRNVGNTDFIILCMKLNDTVSLVRPSCFRQPSVSTRSGDKNRVHSGNSPLRNTKKLQISKLVILVFQGRQCTKLNIRL